MAVERCKECGARSGEPCVGPLGRTLRPGFQHPERRARELRTLARSTSAHRARVTLRLIESVRVQRRNR